MFCFKPTSQPAISQLVEQARRDTEILNKKGERASSSTQDCLSGAQLVIYWPSISIYQPITLLLLTNCHYIMVVMVAGKYLHSFTRQVFCCCCCLLKSHSPSWPITIRRLLTCQSSSPFLLFSFPMSDAFHLGKQYCKQIRQLTNKQTNKTWLINKSPLNQWALFN